MGRNRANRSRTWRPRSFAFVASVAVHGLLGVGLLLLPARPPAPIPEERPIEIVFYAPEEVEPFRPPPEPVSRPEPANEPEPISVEVPPVTFRSPPTKPEPEPEPELAPEPTAIAAVVESTEIVQVQPETRVVALGSFANDAPRAIQVAAPAERETTAMAFEAPGKNSTPKASRATKRGPVAITGAFDVARAGKTSPRSVHAAGTMAPSGFGDATAIVVPAPRKRAGPALDAPVAIVSKPTPLYTDEARKRHIEGEVVLEVTFVVSGALQVHRVVKGLGHGLDEAAIEAAKKIRFEPARKDGRPIDYTATVSVVFRLA